MGLGRKIQSRDIKEFYILVVIINQLFKKSSFKILLTFSNFFKKLENYEIQ